MSSQIDKIKEEINQQTNSELEVIEKEIAEKIKSVEEATEKEIEKIVSSIEESGKSSAENQANRELGQTRLDAKMKYLGEKENGINTIFAEGKEKIKQMTQSGEYSGVLSNLIVSAGVSLNGGNLTIKLLKSDSSKVNVSDLASKIKAKTGVDTNLTVSDEPKTKLGGAIIIKEDLWVDNTFEAIIERRKDSIRSEVAKILFN